MLLHELDLHNHHLLHSHLRRWGWWAREVLVAVVGGVGVAGVAGIGIASVAIVGVACSTPGLSDLK